jgi:hypothetical protein
MWFERGADHRIWVGGPVPPGAAAWTLGSWVIVRRRAAGRPLLLAHEAEHVRQWRDRGHLGFLLWYLAGYGWGRLRGYGHAAAYRRIPAEIEADWRSRRALGVGCDPLST